MVAAVWFALWYFIPAPPSTITIAAGLKGGAFEHIADRYRESLARHHVGLVLRFAENPPDVIRLIKDPKSGVDAAFVFAGQTNGTDSPDLLSLGRISVAPFWIFYRASEPLERVTQLKGKRLNVPVYGDLARQVLGAHGIDAANTAISALPGPAAIKAIRDGSVDAVILPPIELSSPSIQSLLRDPDIRLMNVAQADALSRLFPALNRLVLPQGVIDLEKNLPARDVNLLASTRGGAPGVASGAGLFAGADAEGRA
jgi:NMT1/THI5 like